MPNEYESISLISPFEVPLDSTAKRVVTALKRSFEWFVELVSYITNPIEGSSTNKSDLPTSVYGVIPCGIDDSALKSYTDSLLRNGAKGKLVRIHTDISVLVY